TVLLVPSLRLFPYTTLFRSFTGASLTAHAFDREFAGLGKWLVTLAAWLFALSSMISWSYYGEQSTIYLVGNAGVLPYKFVFLFLDRKSTRLNSSHVKISYAV